MIPLRTDSPLRRTPWMNWSLIAANVLMFVAQQRLWPGNPPYALQPRNPHLYQYFTYQFLHGSPLHLLGNMLFLYIFGNNVNDRMGNWGYLAFYLAGGVAAGIGHVLSSPAPVIGASGSISAVTGAYIVLLPRSHITVLYWFFFIGLIELPSVFFIALSFAMDFILGFGGGDSGVAHLAHISGALFGFLISFVLLSLKLLPRDQFDLFALVQRWNRRRQYRDMVSRGFDPFGRTPPPAKSAVDPNLGRIQDIRAQISEAIGQNNIQDAIKFYLELHAIDPQQVLARQNQLDIANQLFAEGIHGAAADAYEGFIRFYPKYEQIEQVQLMLGLLYARYLNRSDKARQNLQAALERLSSSREIDLAKDELSRLSPAV
ncbi:MAG TPA: rhomboid family intramembrane serine protease [Tepidisphaeraceae bacterium]|nr:rhomboid family intramembrane serine protease [Tepidisphaeraceae bacterium]